MKHKYILPLILLIALSCQKEEPNELDPETLTFSVDADGFNVVESKSTLIDNGALSFDKDFGVYGYCVPYEVSNNNIQDFLNASGRWESKRFTTGPDVFTNTSVSYKDGKCIYMHNGIENGKSWVTKQEASTASSAGYTYTFFAYYPHNGSQSGWASSVTNEKSFNTPTFTFTMPISVTNGYINDSNIPDAMVAETYDHLRSYGAVPLHFRHILTGVTIEVANYTDKVIKIESLNLSSKDFNKKVTVNFEMGKDIVSTSDKYEGTFSFLVANNEVPGGEDKPFKTILLLSDYGNTNPSYLGTGLQLSISYRIGTPTDNGTEYGDLITPDPFPITYDAFKPRAGANYTFTLDFVNGAFTLSVGSNPMWENGDLSDNSNNSTII